jgi:carboxypeptidase Q
MRASSGWASVLGVVLTTSAQAAAPPPDPRPALLSRAAGETLLAADLAELCDRIGGRPTGSPALARAVAWAEGRFRAMGIPRVTRESFSVPSLWLGGMAGVRAVAPEAFAVRAAAAPGTPSTSGAVEAPLVDLGVGDAAAFAKAGPRAAGAVGLVHQLEMKTFEQLFEEYMQSPSLLAAAKQARLSALLLESTRLRGLLYRHPMTFGALAPLPAVVISREAAERLARLAARGEVRMRLDVQNQVAGGYRSENVLGEIPGRERPNEVVVLGAHLDSWDLGTGAEDNGVNVALVLDVARAFVELKLQPRRTVRFVLFTGEEQGMWGSAGYAEKHRAELASHVGVVIFDVGSGKTTGFSVSGRPELRAALASALSVVPGMGGTAHSLDGFDGTDNFDFLLAGIPTFVADQDPVPYLPDYHAESDVFERVNLVEAKRNAGLAAVLVWALAEAPGRPGKQQNRAEVEALLRATGMDAQMKAFGQWDDWVAGKRGFPPK